MDRARGIRQSIGVAPRAARALRVGATSRVASELDRDVAHEKREKRSEGSLRVEEFRGGRFRKGTGGRGRARRTCASSASLSTAIQHRGSSAVAKAVARAGVNPRARSTADAITSSTAPDRPDVNSESADRVGVGARAGTSSRRPTLAKSAPSGAGGPSRARGCACARNHAPGSREPSAGVHSSALRARRKVGWSGRVDPPGRGAASTPLFFRPRQARARVTTEGRRLRRNAGARGDRRRGSRRRT